jgi:hypothetical protein
MPQQGCLCRNAHIARDYRCCGITCSDSRLHLQQHLEEEVATLGGVLIAQRCKVALSRCPIALVHSAYARLHLQR